jgi:hypothetical protein
MLHPMKRNVRITGGHAFTLFRLPCYFSIRS